jgi:uncharacterized protein
MALFSFFYRDTRFFDLLENGAREALNGATSLRKLLAALGNGATETILGDLAQSRRKHKRVANEVTEALTQSFMTPLDREDIETLSNALYKISKTIEKTGERLTICPPGAHILSVENQVKTIESGCAVVVDLVSSLRRGPRLENIRAPHERLQGLEGDADKQLVDHLRQLYSSEQDARLIIYWKDLYDLLEKLTDRCRDVGNIIFRIILKNS